MSQATSTELCEELERIAGVIVNILSQEGGIYACDLDYLSQVVHDLKQEIRLAEARERA